MRLFSSRPLRAWLLAVCLAGGLAPALPGAEEEKTPAQVLAEMEGQVRELRAKIAAHPEDPVLWAGLVMVERNRAVLQRVVETQGGTAGPDGGDRSREAALAVCREWIEARPEEPFAWLALADLQETPEERTALLRQLPERFPASVEVVETLSRDLRQKGSDQAATALVEGFLERHPETADAWRLVVMQRQGQGNMERAREALAGWLERFPGDSRALETWLREEASRASPEELRRMAETAVSRLEVTPGTVYFCEQLPYLASGALLQQAVGCYGKVLAADLPADARQRALSGYASTMARLGSWEDLDRALAALPAAERPRAILHTALGLQNQGRCEDRVRLLERIKGYREESLNVPADMVRALNGCKDNAAARDFYLSLVATVASEELPSVLDGLESWKGTIPPETLEGLLAERLRREPESGALWRSLDGFYEATGRNEKRLAHLQAWIARRPDDHQHDDRTWADLATLLLAADRAGEAVTVLEGALSRGQSASWRLTEQLAALHVLAGHPGKVDELARRFQRSAAEKDRPLASLLLARADLARYRPDDALAHYRELFAAEPRFDQGATEEYLALLYEMGNNAEAVKFLEGRWEVLVRAQAQPARTRAEFMARQLAEAGFGEAALAYQEKAVSRAPENAAAYEKMGQMAAEAGDWARAEEAYRALTRLDPKRSLGWWLLARTHTLRGDAAKALAVLEEGYQATGGRPNDLLLLEGRIHLEGGDAVSAIRVLREVREKAPELGEADELLSEAYRAFARQP